jgi:hypothetical protein
MITVPFALRRFFGFIGGGSDVKKLRGLFREIALFASTMSSQSIDIAALLGSLPTAPPVFFWDRLFALIRVHGTQSVSGFRGAHMDAHR